MGALVPLRCAANTLGNPPNSHHKLVNFTLFPLLPKELQLQIWEAVPPQPRLIIITEFSQLPQMLNPLPPGPLLRPPPLQARCKAPSLIHTCASSRFVSLKSLKPAFELPILVDFEVDIFYFPSVERHHHFPLLVQSHSDTMKIKRVLGMSNEDWPGPGWYGLAKRVLPNLKHAFIVKQSMLDDDRSGAQADLEVRSKDFETLVNGNSSLWPVVESDLDDAGEQGTSFTMMFAQEFSLVVGK